MPRRDPVAERERALYLKIGGLVLVILLILVVGLWSLVQSWGFGQ